MAQDLPEVRHIVDETGLFSPNQKAQIEERLETLSQATGVEVFLRARRFDGFESFEDETQKTFAAVLQGLEHYRVALVMIGIDRREGRGMVGTNLGAGLFALMSRDEAADLFLGEGESFSAERIHHGVDRFASSVEQWYEVAKQGNPSDKAWTPTPRKSLLDIRIGFWVYPLVLGLLGLGVFGLVVYSTRFCPECGRKMRSRVRLGGPGGAMVRTTKCFDCGYVKKRNFEGRRGGLRSRWGLGARGGTTE